MALYVVSYDLRKVRNYGPLYDLLNSWKAARVLELVWLVELTGPATAIRDRLQTVVDNDDGLVVIQIFASSQWGTFNGQTAGVTWMKKHLKS